MKNLAVLSAFENLTMSSRVIAKETGKQHSHVIRDIRAMIKDLKDDPNMDHVSEDKDSRGYTKQMHLPQRETLILISGYSTELRAKIIDRWAELEIKEKARLQKEADRNAARLQAPQMSWALKESRELEGKPTPSHIYSNDYDMINIIVLGKKAKAYKIDQGLDPKANLRDCMTAAEIHAVQVLQDMNTTLIKVGLDYHERKDKLQDYFMRSLNSLLVMEVLELQS